jgi:chromosomal replication initiator protein
LVSPARIYLVLLEVLLELSAYEIWQKALGELQTQVTRANYNTWLRNSHGVSVENGVFIVGTSNAFVAEWLTTRLYSLVRKALAHVADQELDVRFEVHDLKRPQKRLQPQAGYADGGVAVAAPVDPLNARFSFDTFVVGSCNRLAFAASLELAENPCSTFNPLYIYGGTGQGKTHLLKAIGHTTRLAGRDVLYMTAERFTDEFVLAVKRKRIDEFNARFHTPSVVLFDDIQFLAGKRGTQQCFYHIFDELLQRGCQIALTCDHHPRDMQALGDKLQSRLESGMVACIQPPDYEARLSFLQAKVAESDMESPDDALRILAEEVRGNMRKLEGAIVYLSAQARLTGEPINSQTVNRLLNSVSTPGDGKPIAHAVAEAFDVSIEDLLSPKRDRKTARARHVAMYLMRTQSGLSLSEIGRELGGRNHATVLHGIRKLTDELAANHRLQKHLQRITQKLSQAQEP